MGKVTERIVKEFYFGEEYESGFNIEIKPRFATIIYDELNGQIIYEDYTSLIEFIENKFLEFNLFIKEDKKFVYVNSLLKLGINDDELRYAINYLKEKNIYVKGRNTSLDMKEFDNYIYCSLRKQSIYNLDLNIDEKANQNKKEFDNEENLRKLKVYKETNDINIRNELIIDNLGLVKYIIGTYRFDINDDDVLQYGILALIDAINGYDINNNVNFSAYAGKVIYFKISSYMTYGIHGRKNNLINTSYNTNIRKVRKNIRGNEEYVMEDLLNLMLQDENILETEKPEDVRDFINIKNPISLDTTNYDEIDINSDFTSKIISKVDVEKLLTYLKEQDREIIKLRYGFYNNKEYTLREVAKIMGTSYQHISIIEKEALSKMKIIIKEGLNPIDYNLEKVSFTMLEKIVNINKIYKIVFSKLTKEEVSLLLDEARLFTYSGNELKRISKYRKVSYESLLEMKKGIMEKIKEILLSDSTLNEEDIEYFSPKYLKKYHK